MHGPWFLSNLANAHTKLGQFEDAGRCIGEAITAVETTKAEDHWEAEYPSHCRGNSAEITASPMLRRRKRISSARSRSRRRSRQSPGNCARRLAWRGSGTTQGKRDAAHNLLTRVYGWFTEGFDTLDLKEAKTLLDHVGVCGRRGRERYEGGHAVSRPLCPGATRTASVTRKRLHRPAPLRNRVIYAALALSPPGGPPRFS